MKEHTLVLHMSAVCANLMCVVSPHDYDFASPHLRGEEDLVTNTRFLGCAESLLEQ